jgi:hypothetical protein
VAAFVVGRGHLGGDAAGLVRTDGHREDDDVPFVALHILDALDQDGSFVWLRSKWASSDGVAAAGLVWSPLNVTTPIGCDAGIRRRTAGKRFAGADFCHFRSP